MCICVCSESTHLVHGSIETEPSFRHLLPVAQLGDCFSRRFSAAVFCLMMNAWYDGSCSVDGRGAGPPLGDTDRRAALGLLPPPLLLLFGPTDDDPRRSDGAALAVRLLPWSFVTVPPPLVPLAPDGTP